MELPVDLERAIQDAPDDRDAYLVAADWLQQQGAPQGELAALLAADRDPDRALALKHDLLPPALRRLDTTSIEWRWGFVRGVHVAAPSDAAALRDLLASPIARFVQKLVVQDASSRVVDALFDAAAEPRALRCLRTLMVFGDDLAAPLDLPRLSRFPLSRLVLRIPRATGGLALPSLHELSIDRMADVSQAIARSALPSLEVLQLGVGYDAEQPARWLDPARLPALQTLTLTTQAPIPWSAWRAARIGEQLQHLDLFDIRPGNPTERHFVIDRRGAPERAALLVMVGARRGELVPVARPRFGFGRDHRNEFRLTRTRDLERHATLVFQLGQWVIQRSSRLAHTYVNGYDVATCPLRSLDELATGDVVFRFLEGEVDVMADRLRTRYGL